jgi:acyl carrier protein
MLKIDKKIFEALKKTFPKSKFSKNISKLKIGDIKEWDSLGNFNLLLEIEKIFGRRIGTKSFNKIKSVKYIKEFLIKSGS